MRRLGWTRSVVPLSALLPWLMRIHCVLLSMPLLLAACATGQGLTPEQTRAREEVERFVADAARLYRLGHVPVVVGDLAMDGAGAAHRSGTILFSPRALTSPNRDALLAHELGHAVLGHRDVRLMGFAAPGTMGEYARLQVAKELDANAKAVEILARVKGWDEATAVRTVFRWLAGVYRADQTGRPPAFGHPSACDEIRDLLRRYPASGHLLAEARLPGCAP